MYQEGDEFTIHDIEFEGMTVVRLSKLLQGTCMFPIKGIFFLIPVKELSNGLIEIKNDLDLTNCIAIGYKNGKVIDMFLEHNMYDLSHWIQTHIDINDDELSDVKMEDITGFGASDFVGKDDVVIPNRFINDHFLNKLCNGSYINDFNDNSDGGESSQPTGKELEIDSNDEDVDKKFKLVDGGVANRYQLWYRRNDYKSLFVLCGRDLAEGRSGGKKRSPSKKGVHGQSFADKGKVKDVQGESGAKKGKKKEHTCSRNFDLGSLVTFKWIAKQFAFKIIHDPTISYRSIQEQIKKKYLINVSVGLCKRAKQRTLFDHEGGLIKHYSRLRGELLTAMGRDENNQMFPIAWVVVNVENNDNWEWFLACLCEDLRLNSGVYMIVILDGHKDLNSWCRAFFKMDRGYAAYENDLTGACLSVADPTSADPIVVDPTVQTPVLQIQLAVIYTYFFFLQDESVTEDPIDDIPTQQSKTSDTANKIKDAIATGRLKTAGLNRRCKSKRIAKREKPYQFAKDGA
nr:hypothetical protein [Tanacetum cinerariifolium]